MASNANEAKSETNGSKKKVVWKPYTPPKLKFKLQGPLALRNMLIDLGWEPWDPENDYSLDYNLWWKVSEFRPYDYDDCEPFQRLNHFKGSRAICKKDSLARILRKMIGIYGKIFNFSPQSFILPKDRDLFANFYAMEKEDGNDATWICKPSSGAQGRGIYVFREIEELEYRSSCVVQRYLDRPLLIEGYKFDLRIYVVITNYHPLTCYMYRDGLARFSTQKYDMSDLTNQYAHLTNTSINKKSSTVNEDKGIVGPGCKWTLGQLRAWLRSEGHDDGLLWQEIVKVCVLTLLSVSTDVPAHDARGCELLGFDILIDQDIKPWLIEVNFGPSLSGDTDTDIKVKRPLIRDYIEACEFRPEDGWRGCRPAQARELNTDEKSKVANKTKKKYNEPSIRKQIIKKSPSDESESTDSQSAIKGPKIRSSNASILRAQAAAAQAKCHAERMAAMHSVKQSTSRKFVLAPNIRKEGPPPSRPNEMPIEMKERFGNLVRIFPFNDATFAAASGLRKKFDMRTIISEIKARENFFKTLDHDTREELSQGCDMDTTYFYPIENESVHSNTILDVPPSRHQGVADTIANKVHASDTNANVIRNNEYTSDDESLPDDPDSSDDDTTPSVRPISPRIHFLYSSSDPLAPSMGAPMVAVGGGSVINSPAKVTSPMRPLSNLKRRTNEVTPEQRQASNSTYTSQQPQMSASPTSPVRSALPAWASTPLFASKNKDHQPSETSPSRYRTVYREINDEEIQQQEKPFLDNATGERFSNSIVDSETLFV